MDERTPEAAVRVFDGEVLTMRIPLAFKRRGGRKLILAPDGADGLAAEPPRPDGTALRALGRARRWHRVLEAGRYPSIKTLARVEGLNRRGCWRDQHRRDLPEWTRRTAADATRSLLHSPHVRPLRPRHPGRRPAAALRLRRAAEPGAELQHRAHPGGARDPSTGRDRWPGTGSPPLGFGPGLVGGAGQPVQHDQCARAETVAVKPAFRVAFHRRRCLVPADGFYEWRPERGRKQPYFIRLRSGEPLAFAGLWERWTSHTGQDVIESFTIVVTEANELVRPIHDRTPVILAPEDFERWLDPGAADGRELLQPCSPEWLEAYPVSTRVNNPRHNDPGLLEPLASKR